MRRRTAVITAIVISVLAGCQAAPTTGAELPTRGSFLPGTVSNRQSSVTSGVSSSALASGPTSTAASVASNPVGPDHEAAGENPTSDADPASAASGAGGSESALPGGGSTPFGTAVPWTEEFDGRAGTSPDASLFTLRTGGSGWGNQEIETYTTRPENSRLDGAGHLQIQAVREPFVGADGIKRPWTSARMDTFGKWDFTTGTIEIRMKVQTGTGLWPAFWLEGANLASTPWPNCGEIDVAEVFGDTNAVSQTVHGPDSTGRAYQLSSDTPAPKGTSVGDDYHTFSVTRSPGKILFGIDGNVSGTLTPSMLKKGQKWVYDGPMFVLLNFAVGGYAGDPTTATPSPATVLVDWIKYIPLSS